MEDEVTMKWGDRAPTEPTWEHQDDAWAFEKPTYEWQQEFEQGDAPAMPELEAELFGEENRILSGIYFDKFSRINVSRKGGPEVVNPLRSVSKKKILFFCYGRGGMLPSTLVTLWLLFGNGVLFCRGSLERLLFAHTGKLTINSFFSILASDYNGNSLTRQSCIRLSLRTSSVWDTKSQHPFRYVSKQRRIAVETTKRPCFDACTCYL